MIVREGSGWGFKTTKNTTSFTFEMNKPKEVSKCPLSRDTVLPKDDTFFWQPPSINFIGNLPDE